MSTQYYARSGKDMDVQDFISLVNCRHIPAFFLGCVFVSSLFGLVNSGWIQHLASQFCHRSPSPISYDDSRSEKVSTELATFDSQVSSADGCCESHSLFFLLSFCFASASLTFFASLLTFPLEDGAVCAFVIAWGGITSQSARVIGLLILVLELRRLGIRKLETIVFVSLLTVATALVFVNNALATGVSLPFQQYQVSLCTRKHDLATSVASSSVYVMLEGYCVFRFWSLLQPSFPRNRHQLPMLKDVRFWRGLSLLVFDFITVVPTSIPTNIIGEFVPLSIGALIVLLTFRIQCCKELESELELPPSIRNSRISTRHDRTPFRRSLAPTFQSLSFRRSIAPTVQSDPYSERSSQLPPVHYHPFSSKSLNDPTPQGDEWPEPPRTARSSRVVDTTTAKIVQVVKRTAHPFSQELQSSAAGNQPLPDTMMFPKVVARPRLVVVTIPTASLPTAVTEDALPDSSVLRPSTVAKDALNFAPSDKKATYVSTMSFTSSSQPSVSAPTSPSSLEQVQSFPPTASSVRFDELSILSPPNRQSLRRTVGSTFRAVGYNNPIRSRWSPPLGRRSQTLSPLPLSLNVYSEEWPMPPG